MLKQRQHLFTDFQQAANIPSVSKKDVETKFLEILAGAKSNIQEYGTGRDIFERFVKPSIITMKQIASLWAISSLYQDFEDEENVYCYTVKKHDYQKVEKGNSSFVVGKIEIKITSNLEKISSGVCPDEVFQWGFPLCNQALHG